MNKNKLALASLSLLLFTGCTITTTRLSSEMEIGGQTQFMKRSEKHFILKDGNFSILEMEETITIPLNVQPPKDERGFKS